MSMKFVNPHYFSAILDGINHRFILVVESESLSKSGGQIPPRFAIGAINGTKDPRNVPIKNLLDLSVADNLINIPPGKYIPPTYPMMIVIFCSIRLDYGS